MNLGSRHRAGSALPAPHRDPRSSPAPPRRTARAPNTQADAVTLGLPGVLPVLNREALQMAVKFGLAVDAQIAERCVFARKHYFYPDLPKGYQISQYDLPIVVEGPPRHRARRTARPSASASRARTWKRTPASRCTRASPAHDRHRPQPRRHAADRDRLRARHPLGRRGRRVPEEAAPAGRLSRHLRRQHAGRLVPLRRQRLGAPRRRARSSARAPRSRTSTRSATSRRRSSTRSSARSR